MRIKQIVGYPNYVVTDDGKIFNIVTGKELEQYDKGKGYLLVKLYNNSEPITLSVHRIVLSSFTETSELTVNHKNGNKTDNRLENLEYMTNNENKLHSRMVLNRNGIMKLTPDKVKEIRELLASGITQRKIAEIYGLHQSTVSFIKRRKVWKWL